MRCNIYLKAELVVCGAFRENEALGVLGVRDYDALGGGGLLGGRAREINSRKLADIIIFNQIN